jgi:hypothetical protein
MRRDKKAQAIRARMRKDNPACDMKAPFIFEIEKGSKAYAAGGLPVWQHMQAARARRGN